MPDTRLHADPARAAAVVTHGDGHAVTGRSAPWRSRLAIVVLALVGAAVYANSRRAPFIFDTIQTITDNSRILRLWPPRYLTQSTRPVLDLTFAVNYALGGFEPAGYHLVNVLIHIAAGLTLFGIVRRTLLLPKSAGRYDAEAPLLAFAVALLWLVHPLNTQAVTYTVQRGESLMGLFYLLTLYSVIRALSCGAAADLSTSIAAGGAIDGDAKASETAGYAKPRRRGELAWLVAAALSFALALGCKAVAITAPVIVLAYDWTFLRGALLRRLRRWWPLAAVVVLGGLFLFAYALRFGQTLVSDRSVGLKVVGVTPMDYLTSQAAVLLHYLRLSVWPRPLVLDYLWLPVTQFTQALLPGTVIVGLLVLTVWALYRRKAAGFLGAWFFIILSPTSSFMPLSDLAAEHRMYLPLMAVLTLIVAAVWAGAAKLSTTRPSITRLAKPTLAALLLGAAAVLGAFTWQRNALYADPVAMWRHTIDHQPHNFRAHFNGASVLLARGDIEQAAQHLQAALDLIDPEASRSSITPARVRASLAKAMIMLGRSHEAVVLLEQAQREAPDLAVAYQYLGEAHARLGNRDEAIRQFELALERAPQSHEALNDLGLLRREAGDEAEGMALIERAVQSRPDYVPALLNLGYIRTEQGRGEEATALYRRAVAHEPGNADAQTALGSALHRQGDITEAQRHFERALQLNPQHAEAHAQLAAVLAAQGKLRNAVTHFEKRLEFGPDSAEIHYRLSVVLAGLNNIEYAIEHARQAVTLNPTHTPARSHWAALLETVGDWRGAAAQYEALLEHTEPTAAALHGYGRALLNLKRLDDAIVPLEAALRLKPDDAAIRADLQRARAARGGAGNVQ